MVEDYPKTVLELEHRFASEEHCRSYMAALRWPEGFACPNCGGSKTWPAQRGRWICMACRHQATVTAGTIFQASRLPLRLWCRAIWHVTSQKNGASALGLQRVLGLGSYQTAWTVLHKLRRAMVRPGRDKLSGRVEVDETQVGGVMAGRKGRGIPSKALVVIAAEEAGAGVGRIRMARIPDGAAEHLHRFIQANVAPGSVVHTDGWKPYRGLDKLGYSHEVSKLRGLPLSAATELLPRVHRVAALLKRWLLGTHQGAIAPSHLDYYLDEFTFRFNRRTSASRGKLFYRLMQQALQVPPTPYKRLVGGTKNPKHHLECTVESLG
jgi:transposase-like protein